MRTLLLVIAALLVIDVVPAAGRYRPKACTPGDSGAANPCTHLEECRQGRGSCAENNCEDLYRPRLPAMCTAESLPKCFCKRNLYRRNEDGKCVRRRFCKQ
uniref:Putative secreted protein n=1 Tax=Amblyomma americanum TaxID=6943 RepID=A0A0C9SEL7_AMBAM